MVRKHLTEKQRQAVALKEAHGTLAVLAIGIDAYDKYSGFVALNTCSNDAQEVRNAFLDVWQLNADKDRVWALTSKGNPVPSKGEIIKAINRLINMSHENDRILFYYSGHGHRTKDSSGAEKFYLVPQDAYSDVDPEALIEFDRIVALLNNSDAKQRILLIDACMSGPDTAGKKIVAAQYSSKFLAEYMRSTKGVAILSSSTSDQASTTQSPNPKMSLFTYYLVKALRGEQKALDDSMLLTFSSLFDYVNTEVRRTAKEYQKQQFPSVNVKSTGVVILGNFGQAIISPDSFDLDGSPVSNLIFQDWQRLNVKDVLSEIKFWGRYTEGYLETKVNDNLGEYLEEEFGVRASRLRRAMGFSASEVNVDENTIRFPGGFYSAEYVAQDKKSGELHLSLNLEPDWFGKPTGISKIVDSLGMIPDKMVLELTKSLDPESLIAGLEVRGWEIRSQLNWKIVAKASTHTITVEESRIIFEGFAPKELFGDKSDKEKAALASNVLALISGNI